MNETSYRMRLRADLDRWVGEGRVAREAAEAIRAALGPDPARAGAAHYAAIAGVLLFAAAVLVFVAANWQGIPRPGRLGLLTGLIATAFAAGAWLEARDRRLFADLAATLATIGFGATVALVGQMYHLPKDMAGGFALWSLGALAAAALTGSRGAFAVTVAAGLVWTSVAAAGQIGAHLAFLPFLAALAALAWLWESAAARHLTALAFFGWWGVVAFQLLSHGRDAALLAPVLAGATVGLGLSLAAGAFGAERLRAFAATFADYGTFALAFALALAVVGSFVQRFGQWPGWLAATFGAGLAALAIAGLRARPWQPSAAYAAAALLIFAVQQSGQGQSGQGGVMLRGALAVAAAMLILLAGSTSDRRPRLVAGWLAFAAAVAWLVWSLGGGLLDRALLLALASFATMGVAWLLRRFSIAGGAS